MGFIGLVASYVLFSASLPNAPMQDMPDHLTRAHIVADLLFNSGFKFGGLFDLHFGPYSYLLGDLILAFLDHQFGTAIATRLWMAVSVGLVPWGVWFVLRQHGYSRFSAATASLLSLYIATDRFFVAGFLYFQLGIGCALFSYGWYLRARSTRTVSSHAFFFLFLLVGYGVHLSSLIFSIAMIGTSTAIGLWNRELSLMRGVGLMLFPAALFLIYLTWGRPTDAANVPAAIWAGLSQKILRLDTPIVRFKRIPEYCLFLVFFWTALATVPGANWRKFLRVHDLYLFPWLFIGLYLAFPQNAAGAVDVDNRALPYLLLSFVLLGASIEHSRSTDKARFAVALLIAGVNLAYVASHLMPKDSAMHDYKLIASLVPMNASVLPVYAVPYTGRYDPFLHAGAYATLESAAMTPYLFAGDQTPAQTYFRYKSRPPAPVEFWYSDEEDPGIWSNVAAHYRYLIVTVPWNPSRIRLPYTIIKQNSSAALLKLEAHAH